MKRMNTPLPAALRRHTAFLITDIGRLHRLALDREMEKLGLERAEWWLISFLIYFDGCAQQRLAEAMDSSKSVIAKLAEQLERRGLIQRIECPNDARVKRVYLTERSKSLVSDVKRVLKRTAEVSMRKLAPDQITNLTGMLTTIEGTLTEDLAAQKTSTSRHLRK